MPAPFAASPVEKTRHATETLGTSEILPRRPRCAMMRLETVDVELRRQLRRVCPQRPRVYAFYDHRPGPIYVGMSSNLNKRVVSYFYDRSLEQLNRAFRLRDCSRTVTIRFTDRPNFERAGLLRDLWSNLSWLHAQLSDFRCLRNDYRTGGKRLRFTMPRSLR